MDTETPNSNEPPIPPLKVAIVEEDIDILARTLYGEARGEGLAGMTAVAWSVVNRVLRAEQRGGYWWGDTVRKVCLKDWQYTCWKDHNAEKIMLITDGNPAFADCLRIAGNVLEGHLADPTNGAMHYMTKERRKKSWPGSWGEPKEPCAEIGNHLFYNDVE